MITITTNMYTIDPRIGTEDVVFFAFGSHTASLNAKDVDKKNKFYVGVTCDAVHGNFYWWSKFKSRGRLFHSAGTHMGAWASICDLCICIADGNRKLFEEWGAKKAVWVPNSCSDVWLSAQPKQSPGYEYDVIFLGNYRENDPRYYDRSIIVPAVMDWCGQNGKRFFAFGDGWPDGVPSRQEKNQRALVQEVAKARVGICTYRHLMGWPWMGRAWSSTLGKLFASPYCLAITDGIPGRAERFFQGAAICFQGIPGLFKRLQSCFDEDDFRLEQAEQQAAFARHFLVKSATTSMVERIIGDHLPEKFRGPTWSEYVRETCHGS